MPAAHQVPEDHPVRSFFAERDPHAEIYVTHIDSANTSTRQRHFLMQLGMNLVWSFLIIRRLYRGMFRYGVWFVIGKVIPAWSTTVPDFDRKLLGNVFLDVFIFATLLPIIRDFVTGVAILRFRHGFPREEIIFRKPSATTVTNIISEAPEKRDDIVKDLIRRAVEPEELKQASFGLPWEEWAYDYQAMGAACELSKKGVIDAKIWEVCVWMRTKDGWTVVEQGKEDAQDKIEMMEMLKDRLCAMDKMHIFNQMMEVIQVKTVSKNGTRLPVTEDAEKIIADIFRRNDVDFEKLTRELVRDIPPSTRFANSSKKLD